eukprot:1137667-Pyramimonas_sp.AAC.1
MNKKKKRLDKGRPAVHPPKSMNLPAAPNGAQRPAPGQAAVANAPGQAVVASATTPVAKKEGFRRSSDKPRSKEEIEMRAMFDQT